MAQRWPRYPPCAHGTCTDIVCCGLGHKYRWPELIGRKVEEAKAIIERDNPFVTVLILDPSRVGLPDFCCNRVYLLRDANGNVSLVPAIG